MWSWHMVFSIWHQKVWCRRLDLLSCWHNMSTFLNDKLLTIFHTFNVSHRNTHGVNEFCFLSLLHLFDIIKTSCRIPCTFGWTRSQTSSSSLCEDNGTWLNLKCLCVRVRAGRVPFTESGENKSTKRSWKSGRSWKRYFWNSFYFTVTPLTITNLVTICQTIVSTSSSGIASWHDSSRQKVHIPNVYNITDNIANN
jgi:hypothetical protein